MYDEFNPLEHVLLEDALDVVADLDCVSGRGVHLGVSGGVSSLIGALLQALTAALRFDRLRFGFGVPGALMEDFSDPRACCWRVPVGIPNGPGFSRRKRETQNDSTQKRAVVK